ncbi:uncharacterized protein LOC128951476 [Oppia nitens]|uniref:uncharacterized protein LOC128951476 n=1 Tax=Oppia nitens TaxID=1686743 RepID=UPI0023DA5CC0|nr:uncharacterized protein LOC128951476 [Oppia nitens]
MYEIIRQVVYNTIIISLTISLTSCHYLGFTDPKIPVSIGLDDDCLRDLTNSSDYTASMDELQLDWLTDDQSAHHKYECCYNWEALDIQEKFVKDICDGNSTSTFGELKIKWIEKVEQDHCGNLKYSQVMCRLPWWLYAMLAVIITIIVAVVGLIIYFRVIAKNK